MWEPARISNPVWEPATPRDPVCKDCGVPVSTKNVPPPARGQSCAARERNRTRGKGTTRRDGSPARYCEGCNKELSRTSCERTTLCRSCSAKARVRVTQPPRPPRIMDPIKGTAMPDYTTSPRIAGRATGLVELVHCGPDRSNGSTLYNVYVSCDLAGRIEVCEGGWRVQGGDGAVYETLNEFVECLTDTLTNGTLN